MSDREARGDRAFRDWLGELAEAGVDGVQVREKALEDVALLELAALAREVLGPATTVVVNGRADVAAAAGADGVHLPADGVPVAAVRQAWGRPFLVGRSTHHPDEVGAAGTGGADYATFGPVFATPSKAIYGPPPGLAGLRRATAHALPVLALGGIAAEQVAEVAAAGAWGVAGIGAFHDGARLRRLAAARREAWPG